MYIRFIERLRLCNQCIDHVRTSTWNYKIVFIKQVASGKLVYRPNGHQQILVVIFTFIPWPVHWQTHFFMDTDVIPHGAYQNMLTAVYANLKYQYTFTFSVEYVSKFTAVVNDLNQDVKQVVYVQTYILFYFCDIYFTQD